MSFMKLFVVDHPHELNISVLNGHGRQEKLMAAGLLQIDHLDAASISDEYKSVIEVGPLNQVHSHSET